MPRAAGAAASLDSATTTRSAPTLRSRLWPRCAEGRRRASVRASSACSLGGLKLARARRHRTCGDDRARRRGPPAPTVAMRWRRRSPSSGGGRRAAGRSGCTRCRARRARCPSATRAASAPRAKACAPRSARGGHCGVDLGSAEGRAGHGGARRRRRARGARPEEGGRRGNEGRFICINHKGGTVVTSYIHLDGIREDLRPGVPVKAGEAIGTVGDTGVQACRARICTSRSACAPRPTAPSSTSTPSRCCTCGRCASHPVASLHRMEPVPPQRATVPTRPPASRARRREM